MRHTQGMAAGDITETQGGQVARVEAYLAAQPEPQQATLRAMRATLTKLLPFAEEGMKYQMPAVILHGHGVAAYAGFKNHCSYFPCSGNVISRVGALPEWTRSAQGTLQFPVDRPLPANLVRQLLDARLAEFAEVTNGKRYDYFPDGRLKAVGPMRQGQLHGKWQWFRRDGTLLRTGQFRDGEQVGLWQTWDRNGTVARTSRF